MAANRTVGSGGVYVTGLDDFPTFTREEPELIFNFLRRSIATSPDSPIIPALAPKFGLLESKHLP